MTRSCKVILVIDDDEVIRETLKFALESRGYFVLTAPNGEAGLDLLATINEPTLILLDLMMPVMDGWGFIKALPEHKRVAGHVIVVVTASSTEVPDLETIRKPIDLDILFKTVGSYCGGQPNEKYIER